MPEPDCSWLNWVGNIGALVAAVFAGATWWRGSVKARPLVHVVEQLRLDEGPISAKVEIINSGFSPLLIRSVRLRGLSYAGNPTPDETGMAYSHAKLGAEDRGADLSIAPQGKEKLSFLLWADDPKGFLVARLERTSIFGTCTYRVTISTAR